WYPVSTRCIGNTCLAIANHKAGAFSKRLTVGELSAWRTATLEQDPKQSNYYLGFLVQNNWSINRNGQRYNYFTYSAIMLDPSGRIHQLSSQVLNNNLIIRQLSNSYKNQFDRYFGGLRVY
ncbi:hypothetical protein OQH60_08380, partial [Campylobacter sp. MIT 21-1685]|uniref:hypothetical protein n=1 Tax=unclassified Campylobacter TaxID=2593542 RepID=UPI00224B7843